MTADVIITGAAGFIGSHLARALAARGSRVVGVDNFDAFYERATKLANVKETEQAVVDGRFELLDADIRDADAMRQLMAQVRPACVFHLAALAGVQPSIADPARYADVNLRGLVSVLDAARSAACERIVFASSSSVYGNNDKVPFAESDPVDEPISPYAATKKSGELLCHAYAHLFGLRIASLRFFTVYGPAQRPDLAISLFMRRLAAGETLPMYGDGSTSRDYTYIDDIIAGVLAASDRLETADAGFHRIYNLGGSQPVSLSEMIQHIGAVVGAVPRINQLPGRPGDVERTFADLSRSRAELGYEPRAEFSEGLALQWAWMQRSLAGIR